MRMKVSVAMAVYNGEKYLTEQVDSILSQFNDDDELIVSYDESKDASLSILEDYVKKDNRVKVFKNPYKPGVVKNFQNAVEHCTGDIIFYSDQDDVWMGDKIETVMKEFSEPRVAVVFHDASVTDANLKVIAPSTFKLRGGVRETTFGNLFRLSYIGCCMAFRAEYKPVVVPIPTIYRSHDWWTGCLLGTGRTKMKAIHKPLIYHRNHGDNVTPNKRPPLWYQLQVRWIIIKNIILRYRRKSAIDKQRLG